MPDLLISSSYSKAQNLLNLFTALVHKAIFLFLLPSFIISFFLKARNTGIE